MSEQAETLAPMQRMTKQRRAIIDLLKTQENFLSAQEVHDELAAAGSQIGLATVYRNLQALAEAKYVDVLRPENSETQLFRYCADEDHHHHLVCRTCSKTVEIVGDKVESWAAEVAAEYGFSEVTHELEIFGLCAECGKDQE